MFTMGVRHVQALLLFLNAAVLYVNRLHLAVTILAMIKDPENNSESLTFDWNAMQKAFVLSSFYWGYIASQLPSCYLVRRYHVKGTLFSSTFITGILTLLVPICVPSGGWKILCLLRALQGLSQGCHYPAFQQHLAKWSPASERGFLFGLSAAGYTLGEAFAMLMGGLISASTLGWAGTFYITSVLCFVWCALWLPFSANDFTQSKYISTAECNLIESSLQESVNFGKEKLPIPWRAIFSSPPFWSLLIVRSTFSFSNYLLVYYMPTYLEKTFKVQLNENAFSSALPYLFEFLTGYFFTLLADWFLKRSYFSLTVVRKCFNSFGTWLPAAITIALAFIEKEQKILAIVLFMLLMGFSAASMIGSHPILIELAPNYASIVCTLVNIIGILFNILGPLLVGHIVKDEYNRDQWVVIFMVIAISYCLGDFIFLVWGTAQEQPWNVMKTKLDLEVDVKKNNEEDGNKIPQLTNQAFVLNS